jgi:hypothetical protein
MTQLIELIAVLTSAWFAGAAIYINLVEHPARMSGDTEVAATQWAPSYKLATLMQVPLAVSAAVSGVLRGMQGGGAVWFWAAALVFAVIPFTLIVIFPTNHRLLDPRRDKRSAETRQLLERWGRLHAVRTVLGLCASILFVWAATRMQG